MALQFVIADRNVRVWCAAVATLARVGKSITLEWRDAEVILRTLTDSQAAYAAFHFGAAFFESVTAPSSLPADAVRNTAKTRFSAKVLAATAKHPKGAAKLHAYFARADAEHLFVLRTELRNGLTRTHTLTFEDAAILQPVFRREQAPFQLAARPKMLHDVLDRMHGTEEMSVLATTSVVQFQSFHEAAGAGDAPATFRGAMHTALAYALSEFDGASLDHAAAEDRIAIPVSAQGGEPLVAITFNIKELKHIVAFAETPIVKADEMVVFFHCPGQPVLFTAQGAASQHFRCDLVLATLEVAAEPAPSSTLATVLAAAAERRAGDGGGSGGGGGGGGGGADDLGAKRGRPEDAADAPGGGDGVSVGGTGSAWEAPPPSASENLRRRLGGAE